MKQKVQIHLLVKVFSDIFSSRSRFRDAFVKFDGLWREPIAPCWFLLGQLIKIPLDAPQDLLNLAGAANVALAEVELKNVVDLLDQLSQCLIKIACSECVLKRVVFQEG
jgi:hypothetical protein